MAMVWMLLVLTTIIGGSVWWAMVQKRKAQANLQALARRLGLTPTEKMMNDLELRGTVSAREIRFWTYATGSGKSRVNWVAVLVETSTTHGLIFELRRQNLVTKVMEFFGSKEITVGDKAFDDAWFVQTNEPDFLRAALVPGIRAKLMDSLAAGAMGSFKCNGGAVSYAESGSFSSYPQCLRLEQQLAVLQDLADLAEVVAGQKP